MIEHRHPSDDLCEPFDARTAAPLSKLHATLITAAENQTHDYYMNIGPTFADPLARQLYAEIASIEEQHVTQYESIIDPLIDDADYGMKASDVRAVFAQLREQLVPLVRAIAAQPPADDSPIKQNFPEDEQRAFGEKVIRAYGYDFSRGRQDKTAHPFATSFGHGDVRITTRFRDDDLGDPQAGLDPEALLELAFPNRYLQPMDGPDAAVNTQKAIAYCRAHPGWRLSLQTHKLLGIP